MFAAAPIWTFWMAVGVVGLVVTSTLALAVGYFRSVVRPKYPPRGAKRA